jgi:creatinine amidohydrolase
MDQTFTPADSRRDSGIYRLIELRSPEVAALAESGAVVVLPISPLEEHGPHLPLGTDAMLAEHFAGLCAEIVRTHQPDVPVVLAPLIPLGTHVFRFMGSISIRQRVIRNLLIDYGRSLAEAGFGKLIIVSSHGGPKHMVALDEAATSLTDWHKLPSISLTSLIIFRFLSGKLVDRISEACKRPLTDEERTALTMDYHAGWWETSMMLLLRPDLVSEEYHELQDALIPRTKLRHNSPLNPPAGQGYLGTPRRADSAFANASMTVLREEAEQILKQFLDGKASVKRFRSPLYRIPLLRTNVWLWVLLALLVLLFLARVFSDLLLQ